MPWNGSIKPNGDLNRKKAGVHNGQAWARMWRLDASLLAFGNAKFDNIGHQPNDILEMVFRAWLVIQCFATGPFNSHMHELSSLFLQAVCKMAEEVSVKKRYTLRGICFPQWLSLKKGRTKDLCMITSFFFWSREPDLVLFCGHSRRVVLPRSERCAWGGSWRAARQGSPSLLRPQKDHGKTQCPTRRDWYINKGSYHTDPTEVVVASQRC